MNADTVRRVLVDLGWDAEERHRMADVMRFCVEHTECEAELVELDRVREALTPPDATPAGGWSAFEERLRTGARSRRMYHWISLNFLAAAAAFVLGVGLTRFAAGPGTPTPQPDAQAAVAGFTSGDIAAHVAAFQQIDQVYDRQASWVLLAEDEADIGLTPRRGAPRTRVLMLRLLVYREQRHVSDADLIILPGQAAEITVPGANGALVRYNVATTADTPPQLSLWIELLDADGANERLAALATTLHARAGRAQGVGEILTEGGEYQVYAAFAEATMPGSH